MTVRTNKQKKGIFCLDGLLESNLERTSTVQPILKLLHDHQGIPFICKDFAKWEELEFYLSKWTNRQYLKYPILYISSHGQESEIHDGTHRYTLEDLAAVLGNRCSNRIIIVSSCSTLLADKRKLKTFLRETNALAICGYRNDVNFLQATAFELLLMAEFQDNEFSGRGIESIQAKANAIARNFRELEFRMVTVKD